MNLLATHPHITVEELPHVFRVAESLGIERIDAKLSAREYNVVRGQLARRGQDGELIYRSLSREPTSLYDLFTGQLRILNGFRRNAYVGLKITGLRTSYVPQLLSKGVRIIYIYRDPRDIVCSEKNFFPNTDVIERSQVWREYQSVYSGMRDKHLLVLKFEDMLRKKKESLKTLSSFLGVDVVVPDGATRIGKEASFIDNSSFGDLDRPFDERAVHRWIGNEDEDVRFVSYLTGSDLCKYGYDPVHIGRRQAVTFFTRLLRHRMMSTLKSAVRRLLT